MKNDLFFLVYDRLGKWIRIIKGIIIKKLNSFILAFVFFIHPFAGYATVVVGPGERCTSWSKASGAAGGCLAKSQDFGEIDLSKKMSISVKPKIDKESPAHYCPLYKGETKSDGNFYQGCIESEEVVTNRAQFADLTGFTKAGAKTSYHYLANKGAKRLKSAIRKNVIRDLLVQRKNYLSLFSDLKSDFTEINSCADKMEMSKSEGMMFQEFDQKGNPIGELKSLNEKSQESFFNVKNKKDRKGARDIYAEKHMEAALLINSFMARRSDLSNRFNEFDDVFGTNFQIEMAKNNSNSKTAMKKSEKKINGYLSKIKDPVFKGFIEDYAKTYAESSCEEVSVGSGEATRFTPGKITYMECKDDQGEVLGKDHFENKKEEFMKREMVGLYATGEKFPMLVDPEMYLNYFVTDEKAHKSPLMGKIIGDLGFNRTDNLASKKLKDHQKYLVSALRDGRKKDFSALLSSPDYKNTLDKKMGDSSYGAIFNSTNDNSISPGHMKPSVQEYLKKIEGALGRFCGDDDLEMDYHNHKGLAEDVISNPGLNFDDADKLTKSEQTLYSQMGYCYLLENEPPPEGGINATTIGGFGLLAVGGIAAVTGAEPVAAGAFMLGGVVLGGVGIFDAVRDRSLASQEQGYMAIGAGDFVKMHERMGDAAANTALATIEPLFFMADLGAVRQAWKSLAVGKVGKANVDDIAKMDMEDFVSIATGKKDGSLSESSRNAVALSNNMSHDLKKVLIDRKISASAIDSNPGAFNALVAGLPPEQLDNVLAQIGSLDPGEQMALFSTIGKLDTKDPYMRYNQVKKSLESSGNPYKMNIPADTKLNNKLVEAFDSDPALVKKLDDHVLSLKTDPKFKKIVDDYPFLKSLSRADGAGADEYDNFLKVYSILHARGRWGKSLAYLDDPAEARRVMDEYTEMSKTCK